MPAPTPHERLTRAGLSHQFATLVLREHAHALAEQQREWINNRSDMPWWASDIPDLIDPKAKP